uniref:Uncharacterized protein n=1 Tax=Arundo donax TaxID=35708 RepID=A0A0A9H2L9_ARUDO
MTELRPTRLKYASWFTASPYAKLGASHTYNLIFIKIKVDQRFSI